MESIEQQLKKLMKKVEKDVNKKARERANKQRASFTETQNGEVNMGFILLDEESEMVMKELIAYKSQNETGDFFIIPASYKVIVIENLIAKGYLWSKQGVRYNMSGSYLCHARLTQNAIAYDEQKKNYQEQLELMRFQKQNNLTFNAPVNAGFMGCTNLTNCTAVVGDNANIQQDWSTNYEYVNNIMSEIKTDIEKYGLTEPQKEEILEIVEDVHQKTLNKKPALIKTAIKGLFGIIKDIGCPLFVSYLATKFGFAIS